MTATDAGEGVPNAASSLADAVVYGVVPRNFDPPGFAGVTARLDDLRVLGVTHLWLSPITCTLPGHFGYEVTDYFEIRPDYGTNDDFRRLVAAAHARGMRVLMDFVPNHTSVGHPYFQDTQRHGEDSPYWDYYDRDEDGLPTHYFNWDHLPNLNFDNPRVRRFMLEAFAYWLREFEVDGFRVDAVWGIRQRRPDWLTELVAQVRRIEPAALLIAEASARDPFYAAHGFAAVYDWTAELGHWAWEDVFGRDTPVGAAMSDALTNGGRGYGDDGLVLRFLNNNDTGPRFITRYGIGCYQVALAMLLTLPGLPCLFTGDEVGAEYEPYEQPGPIDWTDRVGLRHVTQRLIALRRQVPALYSRQWLPLPAAPASSLFAYARQEDTGREPAIVLLNFSPGELMATLDLPELVASADVTELIDLWSGERVTAADHRLTVAIPGWGYRILAPSGISGDDPMRGLTLAGSGTGDGWPQSVAHSAGGVQ